MPKHGKKYSDIAKSYDLTQVYEVEEALALVKKNAKAKFDETIEVAVRLNLDPRQSDQQIRGAVVLPNGTGVTRRVLVFAKGDKVKEAEAAGADFVGSEELVTKIQGGWFDFDVAIATPDMMGVVGKIGRLLGPKGLMPNPKTGTVTMDVTKAVAEVKAGKIEYRLDKAANVHARIVKVKPAAAKGQYIKNIAVTSTMSPAVRINILKPLGK